MKLIHWVVLILIFAVLGLVGADDMENQSLLEQHRGAVYGAVK